MSLIRWRRQPMLSRPLMRMHDIFDELDRMVAWPGAELPEDAEYGPAVDIFEEGDEVVVKAQLPGVKREDVDVSVQDNSVMIRAETRREETVDEEGYFRRELRYGTWARRLPLPADVDEEQVSAKLSDGMLVIRAKKAEKPEEGGRKIAID